MSLRITNTSSFQKISANTWLGKRQWKTTTVPPGWSIAPLASWYSPTWPYGSSLDLSNIHSGPGGNPTLLPTILPNTPSPVLVLDRDQRRLLGGIGGPVVSSPGWPTQCVVGGHRPWSACHFPDRVCASLPRASSLQRSPPSPCCENSRGWLRPTPTWPKWGSMTNRHPANQSRRWSREKGGGRAFWEGCMCVNEVTNSTRREISNERNVLEGQHVLNDAGLIVRRQHGETLFFSTCKNNGKASKCGSW